MRAVAVMPKASVSTADTLLQIYAADANRPLHVTEISLSAFGTSSTDTPLHVQLVRQSDAGTGGTDVSVRKMDNQLSDRMVKPILRCIDQPYRHVAGDSVVFGLASVSINGISSVQVTVSDGVNPDVVGSVSTRPGTSSTRAGCRAFNVTLDLTG
jgi:hypothetical protein